MSLYKIVFEGKIAEGYSIEDVKKNLASLYKADVGEIQRLFTGRPIVLKEDLDYQTAIKDKETFEKTGAVCSVVSMEDDADHSTMADGEAKHRADTNKSGRSQSLLQPPSFKSKPAAIHNYSPPVYVVLFKRLLQGCSSKLEKLCFLLSIISSCFVFGCENS